MTAFERTHWRDEKLSDRHRKWGFNSPGLDIDWLFIEYDMGEPVALIDYKLWTWNHAPPPPDATSSNVKAFRRLAQRAGIPGLIVYYSNNTWAFCVYPLDRAARAFFDDGETLTELEWVERLYRIRRRVFDEHIRPHLLDSPASWVPGEASVT